MWKNEEVKIWWFRVFEGFKELGFGWWIWGSGVRVLGCKGVRVLGF